MRKARNCASVPGVNRPLIAPHAARRLRFLPLAFAATLLVQPAALRAISCYSDLGIVRDVEIAHLVAQARRILRGLEEHGAPLDALEKERIEAAFRAPQTAWAGAEIQKVLDAHCLIAVSISLEGEIKAAAGPALPYLPTRGWGVFVVKVHNPSGQGSALLASSPHARDSSGEPRPDAWMQFQLWPEGAELSGERVDYFLVRIRTDEQGKREATFELATAARPIQRFGLLTLNRLPVLFTIAPAADLARLRLAHALRHQHGSGYSEAQERRGPPLQLIRAAACMDCHAPAPPTETDAARLAKEQTCIACHHELIPKTAGADNLLLTGATSPPVNRCSICGMADCKMGCIDKFQDSRGRETMLMSGVPAPLFFLGIGAVLVLSFFVAEFLHRRRPPAPRAARPWNLLALRPVHWLFRQGWFRPLARLPIFALFVFLIYAGFAGDSTVNLAPTLTWTIWWAGLIFLVLFLGKAWCFLCPWDFAASLAQGMGRLWGRQRPLTLGLKWPAALRNIHLAIGLFILLTWLEIGFGVTASPRATAWLALAMVALAVVPALLFAKKAFCRHGCMVGRISGLYAMFAPVEVRVADPAVCGDCATRDCFNGNERAPACPTSLLLPKVKENTYCIQCGDCVRSCPRDNVAFRLRPFAADLTRFTHPRRDESLLAVILLALTSFHGLAMTPFWESPSGFSVIGWLRSEMGFGPLAAFTAGMAAILVVPLLFFWLMCVVTRRWVGDPAVPAGRLFLYFAYSLLPVALFYHLAHNAMHFFMEGQFLLPLLSDPLGRGWDLFGTAAARPGPLLAAGTIWWLQVALVVTGHVAGILIADRAARRLYDTPEKVRRALLPMLGAMILYSWFSLWILHLDMNMRGSLM